MKADVSCTNVSPRASASFGPSGSHLSGQKVSGSGEKYRGSRCTASMINTCRRKGSKEGVTGIGWDLDRGPLGYGIARDFNGTTVGWRNTRDAVAYGRLKPKGFVSTRDRVSVRNVKGRESKNHTLLLEGKAAPPACPCQGALQDHRSPS
jgi:hypothetical protein